MTTVSKGNVLGIVALIGALLMIVGVFVSWVHLSGEVNILGVHVSDYNADYTGWQIFTDDLFSNTDYNYASIVTLIAGIVALIAAILPIVLKNAIANRILGVIVLVLGLVALILIVLFYGQIGVADISIGSTSMKCGAGIGLWISLVGSIFVILGGILDIAGKYTSE